MITKKQYEALKLKENLTDTNRNSIKDYEFANNITDIPSNNITDTNNNNGADNSTSNNSNGGGDNSSNNDDFITDVLSQNAENLSNSTTKKEESAQYQTNQANKKNELENNPVKENDSKSLLKGLIVVIGLIVSVVLFLRFNASRGAVEDTAETKEDITESGAETVEQKAEQREDTFQEGQIVSTDIIQ